MHPNQVYKVPPKTAREIVEAACKARSGRLTVDEGINAERFIEVINAAAAFRGETIFYIVPEDEMAQLGMFVPSTGEIKLREDVYDRACEGCAESCFTIMHEVAHGDLHSSAGYCRLEPLTSEQVQNLHRDVHSEEQADLYACVLCLHPDNLEKLLRKRTSLKWISEQFTIPIYVLMRYIHRLSEECGYNMKTSYLTQLELDFK